MAKPTALEMPAPRGPVVTSTPGVSKVSGGPGLGTPLAELLDVLNGDRVVTGEVQQRVKQHAAVTGGQHEAVAVEPLGVLGVVLEELVGGVTHGCAAHRQPGWPLLDLLMASMASIRCC